MPNPFSSQKLTLKFNRHSLGFGSGPETDWTIIMISTLALSVLVIALAGYMFIKIDKKEIFVVEESTQEEVQAVLNITKLRETVDYYQNKAREFQRIREDGVTSTDPSI